MNKSELVEAVASDAGVSRAEAEGVLTSFFDTVKARLSAGDTVGWPGFGKFTTTARQARTGRNPQTGASVPIAASTATKFTSSSVLKGFLNPEVPAKKAGGKATGKKAGAAASTGSSKPATKRATGKATAKKAPAAKASTSTKKAPAAKAAAKRTTR